MAALSRSLLLGLLLGSSCLTVDSNRVKNAAFVERINSGMKLAKEYFGMDSAAMKAADFVMRAFQTSPSETFKTQAHEQADRQTNQQPSSPQAEPFGPLRNVIKLFGLEPTQISAVAVNAIIFVAQMITTFLNGAQTRPAGRTVRTGEPTSWIIEKKSKKLQNLLTLAKNESLPNILVDFIGEQGKEDETSCIQLLMCKIQPFVSKMQDTVFGKTDGQPKQEENGWNEGSELRSSVLYRHLPAREEVNSQSAVCEQRYPKCDLRN